MRFIFFEKQVSVNIGSASPAIRFIPMKNRDARSCQVYITKTVRGKRQI